LVVRGIRGDRGEEKMHNEELNDLQSSPYIVRVIKSRRMRWAGHVVCMGDREVYTGLRWRNLKERDHWEDLSVDGRIISKLIKTSAGGVNWTDSDKDREMGWVFVNTVMNFRIT